MTPELTPDTTALSAPRNGPTLEERRALIERVAASEQFSRSVRLRDFLLYVGKQTLKEGRPDIHEQEIGIRVFGRPESYDRSQDNIVRVNATELRKRVDAYFATAGGQEPLIFEIPRGTYKPVFRWRTGDAEPVTVATLEPIPQADAGLPSLEVIRQRKLFTPERLGWAFLTVMLLAVCAVLWEQNSSMRAVLQPWTDQPAVALFWTGFLDPHRETDLVLPDDTASLIEDLSQSPIQLNEYLGSGFMRRIQSDPSLSTDRKYDLNQIFSHNLVTFGTVRATQSVMGETPRGYPRYLTLARSFTADQLTRSNAVLIGGAKSLPWVRLFDEVLNFSTDYDYKRGVQFVRNRHPKPGEEAVYTVSGAPDSLTGFAVVAFLPNPSHTGHTIILAGTDSDATGAAAAFLTTEDKMAKLHSLLGGDRFPYFEVLLKTSRMSGTFFGADPIAYRAHSELH